MYRRPWLPSGPTLCFSLAFALAVASPAAAEKPETGVTERAFPGAEGWAAHTPGGRGGTILRVTTLAASGPGSLAEALKTKGPRIVVFEVGGVIDLGPMTGLKNQSITITEPFLTVAGQTAPSPGITVIRGGLSIQTHDVVIQHIRVRPGEAGYAKASGWEPDGLTTLQGAHDIIVDHCSFSWSIDENLSTSSKPFEGATPEEWRKHPSQRVTFSHNIIAEGLNKATHSKIAHSKGSLIMDNCSDILILGNLYADNVERNPELKGGTWAAIVNNYTYNPGVTATLYHLNDRLWQGRTPLIGKCEVVGNVMRHGPDTIKDLALVRFTGSGDWELHTEDNLAFDQAGKPAPIVREDNRYGGKIRPQAEKFYWPPGLKALPAAQVMEQVLRDAGARPWDRDAIDQRIVLQSREGNGRVIDSEQQVGGYPPARETRQPFHPEEWDLRTMTRRATTRGEAGPAIFDWDRGVGLRIPGAPQADMYLWCYEWNMFEAMQAGQHTHGTYQLGRTINGAGTEAAIDSAALHLEVKTVADGAKLKLRITNRTTNAWPEIAGIIPCWNPGQLPGTNPSSPLPLNTNFSDPGRSNTFFFSATGLTPLDSRAIHFNAAFRAAAGRVADHGGFAFSSKWPTAETDSTAGLIVRESEDRAWVTGVAWEDWLSVQGHNPWSCMHACVRVGALKPGESREIRGRLYLFRGTKADCAARFRKEF